jgi:hypothetical protein
VRGERWFQDRHDVITEQAERGEIFAEQKHGSYGDAGTGGWFEAGLQTGLAGALVEAVAEGERSMRIRGSLPSMSTMKGSGHGL